MPQSTRPRGGSSKISKSSSSKGWTTDWSSGFPGRGAGASTSCRGFAKRPARALTIVRHLDRLRDKIRASFLTTAGPSSSLLKGEVMAGNRILKRVACVILVVKMLAGVSPLLGGDIVTEPYLLDAGLVSRSISFENPTGAPGEGGKASSNLGVGRKGSPARTMKPGDVQQLCDIEGPGTIRHIWVTTQRDPNNLRSLVLRVWWEGQEHPSIECPIGDFMGIGHGKVMAHQTAVHSVGENAGMIHVLFRRENPTTLKQDFELLPLRKAKGRFIGSLIGIRNLHPDQWWGEGEIKVYMDGDTDFPTICGTGSEDYVGLSWGIQQTPFFYNGCR